MKQDTVGTNKPPNTRKSLGFWEIFTHIYTYLRSCRPDRRCRRRRGRRPPSPPSFLARNRTAAPWFHSVEAFAKILPPQSPPHSQEPKKAGLTFGGGDADDGEAEAVAEEVGLRLRGLQPLGLAAVVVGEEVHLRVHGGLSWDFFFSSFGFFFP